MRSAIRSHSCCSTWMNSTACSPALAVVDQSPQSGRVPSQRLLRRSRAALGRCSARPRCINPGLPAHRPGPPAHPSALRRSRVQPGQLLLLLPGRWQHAGLHRRRDHQHTLEGTARLRAAGRNGHAEGTSLRWRFDKCFHVSPFMPMDCHYDWRFNCPDEDLRVHMQVWRDGARQFDAPRSCNDTPWMAAGWPASWPAIH